MKNVLITSIIILSAFWSPAASGADGVRLMLPKAGNAERSAAFFYLGANDACEFAAAHGLTVNFESGGTALLSGAAGALLEAAADSRAATIKLPRKLQLTNDLTRTGTGTEAILSGEMADIGRAYTGRGVVVGLFDTGIDGQNPNFFDSEGRSRIRRIWHYTSSDGVPTEYLTPTMIEAFVTDNDNDCHGTHVLGTMTGSYAGTVTAPGYEGPNPYTGMAPDAEIAIACGELYDTNIADGCRRIAEYARSVGKPCVINLSLSDILGPHDGSDPFAQVLAEVARDAIVVTSIGNDRGYGRSITKTFSSDDCEMQAYLCPKVWHKDCTGSIAVWSGDSRSFRFAVTVYDTQAGEMLAEFDVPESATIDNPLIVKTTDCKRIDGAHADEGLSKAFRDSYIIAYRSDNADTNGRPEAVIEFDTDINREFNDNRRKALGFKVEGSEGQRMDVTMYNPYGDFHSFWTAAFSEGGDEVSFNSNACAEGVISVGAWSQRVRWDYTDGHHDDYSDEQTEGEISPFSSFGTDIHGVRYPTVAAPGANTISASSTPYVENSESAQSETVAESTAGDGRRLYWTNKQGTSMSSPAVAGAIALWLEADPTLTSAEVADIIRRTADTSTAGYKADPAPWGAGRFDALAGLRAVLEGAGTALPATDNRLILRHQDGGWTVTTAGGAAVEATLADLHGRILGQGTQLRCPGPGLYIIKAGATAFKAIAK